MTKAMLASDAVEGKIKFPCFIQPKIDGVRGLNMTGSLTGRSLKRHANLYTSLFYSREEFRGLDGELAADHERHPDLCRLTTSALSRIEGAPYTLWHVFDYVTSQTELMPYETRYAHLESRVRWLQWEHPESAEHLRVVPSYRCNSLDSVLHWDAKFLELGYEGSILRDPKGKHKQGRSTVKEGGLLRIKRFVDAEAVVTGVTEGETNNNDAQINELGLQFRSTHQVNMVKSGMIGALTCRLLKPVVLDNDVLFAEGSVVTVSPGKMTAEERAYYFANPSQLMGKIIKFQFFPKGIKDKPRFPTFQCFRALTDM